MYFVFLSYERDTPILQDIKEASERLFCSEIQLTGIAESCPSLVIGQNSGSFVGYLFGRGNSAGSPSLFCLSGSICLTEVSEPRGSGSYWGMFNIIRLVEIDAFFVR